MEGIEYFLDKKDLSTELIFFTANGKAEGF